MNHLPNSILFFMIALMMETASIFEALVNFYQTTQRYNPEDSHLRTRRRENLKSYATLQVFLLWIEFAECEVSAFLMYPQSDLSSPWSLKAILCP
jgi:hypothetical protein